MSFKSILYLIKLTLLINPFPINPIYCKQTEPIITPFLKNNFEIYTQTWAISQNPKNRLLFFANSDGLIEYDGIKWKNHSLPHSIPLRSVVVDSFGKVYTGTFEDFGYWEPNQKGVLIYNSLAHLTSIEKNDEIWKIYIKDSDVYFQSFTTVYIYTNGIIEKVKAPFTMLFLHNFKEKFIAQLLDNGLYWFENKQFRFIEKSEFFSNIKVLSIIEFTESKWIVCTEKNGLYLFDGKAFSPFNSDVSDFLKRNVCNAANKLNDTTYAFGSIQNGLVISNQRGEILLNFNTLNGLKNNTVLSLYSDQDNGLWTGLDGGVSYFNISSPYTHYKSIEAPIGTIYSLLKKDNKLYIGTNLGLFETQIEKKGRFYHFKHLRFIEGAQGQVWSLKEYENQILCGHNDGTFLVNNGAAKSISNITGGWAFAPFGKYILQGTYTGIVVFSKSLQNNWTFYSKLDGFNEPSRFVEVDYLGYVWVSHHQKGIYRLELSEDFKHVKKVDYYPKINEERNIKVFSINNRVVFATSHNIYTFDYVRNEMVPLEELSSSIGEFRSASFVSNYKKNLYWFVNNDKMGLFKINLDFSTTKIAEIQLKNLVLPQRNIEITSIDTSTLIIPTSDNFDTYDLSLHKAQSHVSKLLLSKVSFFGGKGDAIHYLEFEKPITSNWNKNNITVQFAAPFQFDQISKNYLYRIKELDSSWQTTNNNHFTYLGLKHGLYTIEIAGPNEGVLQVSVNIRKPWYLLGITKLGYLLLLVLIVLFLRKYVRYIVNREKEISAMEVRQSILEKELDYKNYELMLTVRYLIQKNEILTELKSEIERIKEHSSKYPIKNIRSMEHIIYEGLKNQTEDWKNALNNLKFSELGFNKKLLEHFPHLTSNDLRLCTYLRMNFSTKEIARLLNIAPRAVEISRYRLRKKLNLAHDSNLTVYLISESFNKPS